MSESGINVSNYVTAFLDVLGQREKFENCGLLPDMSDSTTKEEFLKHVKKTVGTVGSLHKAFDDFYAGFQSNEGIAIELEKTLKKDNITQQTDVRYQRFSDGLVPYFSINGKSPYFPVKNLYSLIGACASVCFIGLCRGEPIRGGVDVGWGCELNDNELYGCTLVKAYSLESDIAEYPRVVLGDGVMKYLHDIANLASNDLVVKISKELVAATIRRLKRDYDGRYIVDYLCDDCRASYTPKDSVKMFTEAYGYVCSQEKYWQNKNMKLAERYQLLKNYFDEYKQKWL